MGFLGWLSGSDKMDALKSKISELESKNSDVFAELGRSGGAGTRNTSRNYKQLAEEGYSYNPVVRRCINLKASNITSLPWTLTDGNGDLVEDHPILDLLAKPNTNQTPIEFWEQFMLFLDAGGGVPMHASGDNIDRDPIKPGEATSRPGLVQELYVYRPDQVEIVSGTTGVPAEYVWNGNGQRIVFPVDSMNGNSVIKVFKYANALGGDPFRYGTPSLQQAAFAIDCYNESMRWNTNLLENLAVPPGYYKYEGDDNLTPDQVSQYNEKIQESLAGSKNGGKTPFLGKMSFVATGIDPNKMGFEDLINVSSRQIALAEDVPSQLLGIPGDNTYANYEQALLAFWTQTMIPLGNRITSGLNAWLVPMYDPEMKLGIDLDRIDALESVRERKWKKVQEATFLSVNDKREELDFDPLPEAEADQVLIPAGMVPLSMVSAEELDAMKAGMAEKGFSQLSIETFVKNHCCVAETKTEAPPETSLFYDPDTNQIVERNLSNG